MKADSTIIHTDYLKSLHRNFNNAWNNKAYSLVDKMRFVVDLRLLVMHSDWVSIDAGTNSPPPFTTSRMNSSLVSSNTEKNAKKNYQEWISSTPDHSKQSKGNQMYSYSSLFRNEELCI